MRKYGISESKIQARIMTLLPTTYVVIIIGLVLWIQRCYTFSFGHCASSAWCIMRYTVLSWSCLLSFLCNPYIPFLIYEIFHLLVILGCIHVGTQDASREARYMNSSDHEQTITSTQGSHTALSVLGPSLS